MVENNSNANQDDNADEYPLPIPQNISSWLERENEMTMTQFFDLTIIERNKLITAYQQYNQEQAYRFGWDGNV